MDAQSVRDGLPHEAEVRAALWKLATEQHAGRDGATAMAALVAVTSRLSLLRLDPWEGLLASTLRLAVDGQARASRWWMLRTPTRALRKRAVCWVDIASSDGFRREACLRTMPAGAPDAFFLALAMRRLNDWVPQVRAAAREMLPRIAAHSAPEHVVNALWHTFANWVSWGRMAEENRSVLAEIVGLESVAPMFALRIRTSTAGPAPHVLSQACRAPVLDPWLDEIARNAVQPAVRARAHRYLLDQRAVWVAGHRWKWTDVRWSQGKFEPVLHSRSISSCEGAPSLLRTVLADPSSMVRRIAAEYVIAHADELGTAAMVFARQLAGDRCESIAARGRFAMAMLGGRV